MKKNWSKRLLVDVAAVALGASLTLAFAPFELFPLAVIAPAGLLALWSHVSPRRACWLGFLFGVGLFTSGTYWIFISIHEYGDVNNYLTLLITMGFISILSGYPALVGYLTNRFFPLDKTPNLLCAFPTIWVTAEWIRSWLLTGFPWLFLGYSQTHAPLKGYAPLLGVYGVSLAVALTSALAVLSYRQYKQKNYYSFYLSLFAITFIWISGSLLNLINWTVPVGKPLSVSLVQGNIPQSLKWSPEHIQLSLSRYKELTEPELKKHRVIIWPEAAIPLPLHTASKYVDSLDEKANINGANIIFGIPMKATEGDGYYNAIVSLGKNRNVYLKRRLVPFGEYVPFQRYVARLFDFMNVPMSNLVPGQIKQQPFEIENVKILPSICFEITVPELMRTSDESIGVLLTVTNDAWFGKSIAQAQHLQMGEMRALEFKRPVLFVSNDGITAIIGPDGNIVDAAPTHQIAVLNGNVQPRNGLTPWTFFGADPLLSLLLTLIFLARRAQILEQQKIIATTPSVLSASTNK